MRVPEVSVEFFPPQTEDGMVKLRATRAALAAIRPEFFSVTYGAGGSTRERTLEVVAEISREGAEVAPHLSCIGSTRAGIREMLARFRELGIRRIVALRGDLPSGMADPGELRYANELVAFIRAESGDEFRIEVAAYPECHPQAPSPGEDLVNFKRKVDAGADSAITQYFFNSDAYEKFVEDVRSIGADIPIVPGIMPIGSYAKLARFSDACGAEIPRWMRCRFESFRDDPQSAQSLGLDIVTSLCDRLVTGGAPGLHFYSMNQSGLVLEICKRLGYMNVQQDK